MDAHRQLSTQTPAEVLPPAVDPGSDLQLGPLIENILKTGSCEPDSLFLVEGVDANVSVSRWHRAVRLLLGDGKLCIQALLSPALHSLVDIEDVTVGTYVRVAKFSLHHFSTGRLGGKSDRPGQNEDSKFVYLLVEDMAPVGWNSAFVEAIKHSAQHQQQQQNEAQIPPPPQTAQDAAEASAKAGVNGGSPVSQGADDLSDSDDAFETMHVSQEKANLRRTQAGELAETAEGLATPSHGAALPWASNDPTQPVKLTNLRSIPFLPYQQNWRVNILAVVAQLSDLEASHLPPYQQRTARLADPSTKKQVHLTVFLDPGSFAPRVGSVVLLLGVKNHRFDGGSLKMYVNERPTAGSRWWFEDPMHLDWCDVEGLKAWWASQAAVEL